MTEEPESEGQLPQELDVTAYRGPYLFPNTKQRRVAGYLYLLVALISLASGLPSHNRGLLLAAAALILIAIYNFITAWNVRVNQYEALFAASRTVGFPIGHASAQLAWRGLRSKPTWRILLYSADDPPTIRGLVEVDATTNEVLSEYTMQLSSQGG